MSQINQDVSWPSGHRDTTQIPELTLGVSVEWREHLKAMLQLEGVAWNDYQAMKEGGLGPTSQRARTYRKMYEVLGAVGNSGGTVRLSRLGRYLANLETEMANRKREIEGELRNLALGTLYRYQFDNPIDRHTDVRGWNVHPFYCIWKIMLSCEQKLHYHEVNRVVLHLSDEAQIPTAVDVIRKARAATASDYSTLGEPDLERLLGRAVHREQVPARIAPWFSLAGWGGLLIDRESDDKGYRHIVSEARDLLLKITTLPPPVFLGDSEEEWFAHHLLWDDNNGVREPHDVITGNAATLDDVKIQIRRLGGFYDDAVIENFYTALTYLSHKHFVILRGISGTGKSLLIRAYARAVHGIDSLSAPDPFLRFCPVRPDWTDPTGLIGYFDMLTNNYIAPPFIRAVIDATNNPNNTVYVCIDEMNLARVEYYLSDFLSAWESREPITLHSADTHTSDGLRVPAELVIPNNLYVIGTINVDETTVGISDKVLDRAMVIDLSRTDLRGFLDHYVAQNPAVISVVERYAPFLSALEEKLQRCGTSIGYRTVEELVRYVSFRRSIDSTREESALDEFIVQKILTKMKGNTNVTSEVNELLSFLTEGGYGIQTPSSAITVKGFVQSLAEYGSFHASR